MKKMEEKILAEGEILSGGVLKVGSFLNQQIDTKFMKEIGEEIAKLFDGEEITKILTIEASGIPIAVSAGFAMNLPVVYAKTDDHHASPRLTDDMALIKAEMLPQSKKLVHPGLFGP